MTRPAPPPLDVSKDDPGDSPRGPLSVASDTSHSTDSPSVAKDEHDDDFTFDSPRASSPSFSPSSVSGNGSSFDRDSDAWFTSPASVTKDSGEEKTGRDEPRVMTQEWRDVETASETAADDGTLGTICSRPFQAGDSSMLTEDRYGPVRFGRDAWANLPLAGLSPTPPVDVGPETKGPISPRAARAIGGWRMVRRPKLPSDPCVPRSRSSPRVKGRRLVFA